MSSSIFFRFKSQKESQRVQFDGTSISVWEAKREIIALSKLGDGTDFDLAIYNEDSNEGSRRHNTSLPRPPLTYLVEYDDDTTLIPRSTSVIARRLPAAKPGQGRAARYVSGRMPVNARNSHRTEQTSTPATLPHSAPVMLNGAGPQTEEERIAAMFADGASQWKQQKEQMASQVPMPRTGGYKPNAKAAPDHPPPPGYLCYRCGEKGHWIQACPTNNDPSWEGRPRVKRTTGIPKSQLKTIEKPKSLTNDGLTDDARQPSGVMVNAEGEYVVAVPDQKSWEQYQTKAQASAEQAQANTAGSKELEERGLQCPIDKRLFVDPVKTPCCGTTYCNECIDNALANSDLVCPGCSTADVLIDDVIPDVDMVGKIKAYEEEKKAEKAKAEKPASPEAAVATTEEPVAAADEAAKSVEAVDEPAAKEETKNDAAEENQEPAKERTASPAASTTSSSNKRKASEDISAEQRIPTGPKAMRAQQQTAAPPMPIPPGFDASFVEQMNKLAGGTASTDVPNFSMGMGMPPMMPAAMSQGMAGMNPAMMMGMMNPMMMQQMGMPNFGMNGMGMGMGNMNFPMGNNFNNGQNGFGGSNQNTYNNGQNWNNYQNGRGNGGSFAGVPTGPAAFQNGGQQNGDDDAYMRKPLSKIVHNQPTTTSNPTEAEDTLVPAQPLRSPQKQPTQLSTPIKKTFPSPRAIGASKIVGISPAAARRESAGALVVDDLDEGVDYDAITPGVSFLDQKQGCATGFEPHVSRFAGRRQSEDVRLDQAVRAAFGTSTPPLSVSGSSIASSQGGYFNRPATEVVEATKSSPIKEFLEVWDYKGGARFRGFTVSSPSTSKSGADKAMFIFFDHPVISLDLKQGLMALIELASTPQLDCQRLIVCLERDDAIGTARAEGKLLRDLRWVGFEGATLDEFASRDELVDGEGATLVREPTSERWMMLGMDV
ncbi:hypothetical protein FH972_023407 [Carpinus fangiana]|uniref:CCHC-type domain-containing protein n=1 Tax=Carpinus fangiana TaxID=176857 RepID=A0A5N6KXD8_9ROSI|nr:hypothetical protein FH972_023407 [Carpinus fangiana]